MREQGSIRSIQVSGEERAVDVGDYANVSVGAREGEGEAKKGAPAPVSQPAQRGSVSSSTGILAQVAQQPAARSAPVGPPSSASQSNMTRLSTADSESIYENLPSAPLRSASLVPSMPPMATASTGVVARPGEAHVEQSRARDGRVMERDRERENREKKSKSKEKEKKEKEKEKEKEKGAGEPHEKSAAPKSGLLGLFRKNP